MVTDDKNYYELLGVGRDATKGAIKAAYREIALIYHPDSKWYTEIVEIDQASLDSDVFKQITAAYSTLIDPEKRKKYDSSLPPLVSGSASLALNPFDECYSKGEQSGTLRNFGRPGSTFGRFGIIEEDEEVKEEFQKTEIQAFNAGPVQGFRKFWQKLLNGPWQILRP